MSLTSFDENELEISAVPSCHAPAPFQLAMLLFTRFDATAERQPAADEQRVNIVPLSLYSNCLYHQ